METIICAIAKLENCYIYDWVSYHLNLGFDCIHVYDNNDVDGEYIKDVFQGTELESRIIIHDVRGQKYVQKKVYQECYDTQSFDWCAFIDIDEYIVLEGFSSIQQYLSSFSLWDAIHVNWKCYGDSGLVNKDSRSVELRFTHPWKRNAYYVYVDRQENEHIKSIIRAGSKIDWLVKDGSPHTPAGLLKVCNAIGMPVNNEPFAPICHQRCYIKHYITKTIEEYADKVNRQCADCDAVFYSFPKFFRNNRITYKKIRWLKKHYPMISVWSCFKERFIFIIINYNLPLRFLFRSLSR